MARILLVFEPPGGGVAEHIGQLVAGLPGLGFDIEVAAPGRSDIDPVLGAAGVAVHRLALRPGFALGADELVVTRRLAGLLRSGRFDLVHAHSARAGVLVRLAAPGSGVPVVFSPHSFAFVGDFSARRRQAATLTERLLAPLAARIVCVCQQERQLAVQRRIGRPDRLRVVLNGVPACPPGAPDPALAELRGDGVLVASLAELRPQKSIDLLIDATPAILDRTPDARVAIVGSGPLEADLRVRARAQGLLEHPRFAMVPFRAPGGRYLRTMDVYVLPSSWEALPLGVLEAQACGVPQVATDVGGTREAVDAETGVLVAPGDPDALASAVIALVADAGRRRRLAEASRHRHAERFAVARMLAETAEVYRELLDRHARG